MNTRYSAAALLAAVFFAGVAGTLGVLRVVEHRQYERAWEARTPSDSRPWDGPRPSPSDAASPGPRPGGRGTSFGLARMEFTDRLARRLDLTDEQKAAVVGVMEERRRRTQELMESVAPALRSQTDSLQAEIEAILTEEQRTIYRSFANEGRDRFRGHRRSGDRLPS